MHDFRTANHLVFIGLDNLEPVEQKFRDHPEIALMVVDPIQSYLGEGDLNKEQSVRAILTPLQNWPRNTRSR